MSRYQTKPQRAAYPADRARQGTIILRKPWQRIVFIAGLAGFVLLAIAGRVWFGAW